MNVDENWGWSYQRFKTCKRKSFSNDNKIMTKDFLRQMKLFK